MMTRRPGGFIDYGPQQQKMFDRIKYCIEQIYKKNGYEHIMTPSVEKIDVLKKGGEEIANQIFGLYGLAQGPQDTKDYALRFDLTVPFARYVVDRKNELTFPFKRYQIQPVRRGERSQKGRYKEFFQADIDVIRPNIDAEKNTAYYHRYDAEIINTIFQTVQRICQEGNIVHTRSIHLNNKNITLGLIQRICHNEQNNITNQLLLLFDKFYKIGKDQFVAECTKICSQKTSIDVLQHFLFGEITIDHLKKFAGQLTPTYDQGLEDLVSMLQFCHAERYYIDPFIVRGLDYYTGTVFETFFDDFMSRGSFASGGSYNNFTDFLDPKQQFSGTGGSIGLSRLFSLLNENNLYTPDNHQQQLLVTQIEGGYTQQFHELIKALQSIPYYDIIIYPLTDKLGKQFQYAEKKGIEQVVIYGPEEQSQGHFIIKNLRSGEQTIYQLDYSYGVIPYIQKDNQILVCLVQNNDTNATRSFPKGHQDPGESIIQTIHRECKEEIGGEIIDDLGKEFFYNTYFIHKEHRQKYKINRFVLGRLASQHTTKQDEEIRNIKRLTPQQILQTDYLGHLHNIIKQSGLINKHF